MWYGVRTECVGFGPDRECVGRQHAWARAQGGDRSAATVWITLIYTMLRCI
jgi:hypothetical protein